MNGRPLSVTGLWNLERGSRGRYSLDSTLAIKLEDSMNMHRDETGKLFVFYNTIFMILDPFKVLIILSSLHLFALTQDTLRPLSVKQFIFYSSMFNTKICYELTV